MTTAPSKMFDARKDPRPTAQTHPGRPPAMLAVLQDLWDRDAAAVREHDAVLARVREELRPEKEARAAKAAAERQADADRQAAREAARLEVMERPLREGYLDQPGATAEGWATVRDRVLEDERLRQMRTEGEAARSRHAAFTRSHF